MVISTLFPHAPAGPYNHSVSLFISRIVSSLKTWNNYGDKTQPWRTPAFVCHSCHYLLSHKHYFHYDRVWNVDVRKICALEKSWERRMYESLLRWEGNDHLCWWRSMTLQTKAQTRRDQELDGKMSEVLKAMGVSWEDPKRDLTLGKMSCFKVETIQKQTRLLLFHLCQNRLSLPRTLKTITKVSKSFTIHLTPNSFF